MAGKKRGKGGAGGKPPARPPGRSSKRSRARGLAAGHAPPAGRKPGRPQAGTGPPPPGRASPGAPEGKATAARPARPRTARGDDEARPPPARARGLAARAPAVEPDPDGYFVARVRGEEAVRSAPHPLTEAALEAARGAPRVAGPAPRPLHDEALGELPWSYGDDALVALPRDPRTLFLYWDHAVVTARRAWEGIDDGRAELWIFAALPEGGWERVRVVDFAIEARSWYVHDLEPGRVHRAEIHLVDHRQDRLLAAPSNPVLLPPVGPSPLVDDRLARIPWGEQLGRLLPSELGRPFPDELRGELMRLSDWSRVAGGEPGAGGMGGRPSSPAAPPGSSPSSPWGGGRSA